MKIITVEGSFGQLHLLHATILEDLKWLRSVDFGSIQIMNCLLNDDAEEVIGTRSSQVIYCLLTKFPSDHKMTIHGFGSAKDKRTHKIELESDKM